MKTKMNKHQKVALAIMCGVFALLLGIFIMVVKSQSAKPHKPAYNLAPDLPEELEALTTDSAHPDLIYAWKDSVTGQPRFEMRNYKRTSRAVLYEKE